MVFSKSFSAFSILLANRFRMACSFSLRPTVRHRMYVSPPCGMTTIGGVFIDRGQHAQFASCGFDRLEFCRPGLDAKRLIVPILTQREMRYLEAQLPLAPGAAIIPPQTKSSKVDDSMSSTNHGCHHP